MAPGNCQQMQTLVSCHTFTPQKNDICLQILRRWKPVCCSLYRRCLGRYHSYSSSWSSGTVENTTCQSRSGITKFPNTPSHRSQPAHDPTPRQPITYISLSVKRELQSSPSVQENSFSGSSIAFLQNELRWNVPWVPGQPQSGAVSAAHDSTWEWPPQSRIR